MPNYEVILCRAPALHQLYNTSFILPISAGCQNDKQESLFLQATMETIARSASNICIAVVDSLYRHTLYHSNRSKLNSLGHAWVERNKKIICEIT